MLAKVGTRTPRETKLAKDALLSSPTRLGVPFSASLRTGFGFDVQKESARCLQREEWAPTRDCTRAKTILDGQPETVHTSWSGFRELGRGEKKSHPMTKPHEGTLKG